MSGFSIRRVIGSCEHSFLLHEWDKVVYDVLFWECVQNVIAWDDVAINNVGILHSMVNVSGRHLECSCNVVDTEYGKCQCGKVHFVFVFPFQKQVQRYTFLRYGGILDLMTKVWHVKSHTVCGYKSPERARPLTNAAMNHSISGCFALTGHDWWLIESPRAMP